MHEDTDSFEVEIRHLKERNLRVDADKAWETSSVRILIIAGATYGIACLLLYILGVNNFYFAAFVPFVGYILSAQSLPHIKKYWIRNFLKDRE